MLSLNMRLAALICLIVLLASGVMPTPAEAQGRDESRARQVRGATSGEVTIAVEEQFVNSFLEAIFNNLKGPSFSLSSNASAGRQPAESSSHGRSPQQACPSIIVLEREKGGVRTSVHFEEGKISAPLAFSGSYSNSLLGCLRFEGWADTTVNLEFDREKQSLNARAFVKDIHLIGVPALANGPITSMVQNAMDKRINPIPLLQTSQLTAQVPIPGAGGAVRLHAKEVRPEILAGALRLHVYYDFIAP